MRLYNNISVREFNYVYNLKGQKMLTAETAMELKGKNIIWTYSPADGNYQDILITTIGEITTDNMGRKMLMDENGEWSGMFMDDEGNLYCSDADRFVCYVTEDELKDTRMITTLDQLADYVNEGEDYPLDTEDIVKANGWTLGTNEFDVCKNDGEILTMDENSGVFVVKPYNWGGKREGAGRKALYSEKKQVKVYLTDEAVELLTAEQEDSGLSRSDVLNKLILENLKRS